METKRTFAWIGFALSALLVLAALSLRDHDSVQTAAKAEPDLFPFLKPMADAPAHSARMPDTAQMHDNRAPGDGNTIAAVTPTGIAGVEQQAQLMRSQGASEDEIYRMRAAALSAEVAARLGDMEHAERAWQMRVNAYLSGRGAGAGQPEALQDLRNAYFTQAEQERLAAYEPRPFPRLEQE